MIIFQKTTLIQISILVDDNTNEHCWPVLNFNTSVFNKAEIIEIPSGEHSKTMMFQFNYGVFLMSLM